MLAIGGWNEGSSRFSPMVANPERRKELIKNTIKFLRQNHFDGLDLDWEYPSFRDGGKSRDRDNYAQLVQELREEFERESDKTGRPRLLLTMAVPAGIEYINKGYDVPKLTKYLDWMNILSYDYHSAFEPAVNHHAPLFSLEEPSEYNYDTELNIDYTIKHYLEMGADPNKLVMGIPTYGRSYTLFNPDANEIGAPADGPGDMGDATRENGYLAYYEICENIKTQDWEVVQPNPDVMGPYAYKDNQWVGYDDDAIARKKAAYVAENGLGGIMFWSIDNDDFRGNCHGKPYPIIEAAKEALISAYGLTDENLVSPPAKTLKTKTRTRPQTSSKSSFDNKDESSDKKRISTSGGSRRRNRVKSKSNDSSSSNRPKIRRKESRRTTETPVYSSLELVTPSYTTPAPPSTPDQGGVFKCEDEGFYPHPKDCKKYFWCLSGPGELGIIAHQFTCPAAADSCDYTRNVLCNKKLSKTTTTTTTTTEATTSKTTSRVPPKITAATSRTTLFRTTTTEAYDDEYEYEDEEDFDDTRNSEEDPKVIKELLDLIKKAGGIEELEKQLKIHDDGSASVSHPDATTPSSISKSLVEKVLGKAARNNIGGKKNSNSRGPQNEGLSKSKEKEKHERGRPQYTTITRQ
ncbi:mucin-22, partial [Asbolus verrucosus]